MKRKISCKVAKESKGGREEEKRRERERETEREGERERTFIYFTFHKSLNINNKKIKISKK
jgi:hypothetical protein